MTEADFLRAIVARPDDDTPRLAFADWLDDHAGDLPRPDATRARAEFVRCHVRAVQTRCVLDPADDPDAPRRYPCGGCPACVAWRRAEGLFATAAVAGWDPAEWDCYLRNPTAFEWGGSGPRGGRGSATGGIGTAGRGQRPGGRSAEGMQYLQVEPLE